MDHDTTGAFTQATQDVSGPVSISVAVALIPRIECYLQITRQSLSLSEIGTPKWTAVCTGFLAALHSPTFEDRNKCSKRTVYVRARAFLAIARAVEVRTGHPSSWSAPRLLANGSPSEDILEDVLAFERQELDLDRARFWNGWIIQNKAGRPFYLRFYSIHARLGASFTDQLAAACQKHYSKGSGVSFPVINDFARYIGEHPSKLTVAQFGDPEFIGEFFSKFFLPWYFLDAVGRGVQVSCANQQWVKFIDFVSTHLIGDMLAEPYIALPRPEARATPGAKTNIRTSASGQSSKHVLVTPVPLHVTDSEAKEILFARIQEEVDSIKSWAKQEVDGVWSRREQRLALALEGTPRELNAARSGGKNLTSTENPDRFKNAAATFEKHGLLPSRDFKGTGFYTLYPNPTRELSRELGIPCQRVLAAFAILLIDAHPKITASFLSTLKLFDRHGKQTGFVQTDAGYYLVGDKRRKGSKLAEQRILLTDETTELVRQLIALTEPARNYLKKHRKDWRNLLIGVAALGCQPRPCDFVYRTERDRRWLARRFERVLSLPATAAEDLATRCTLKRFRASCGVLVYLKTRSIRAMAEALGHEVYSPNLLDHYLPRPIQEFFTERWVRLFQCGIIVEALRESPFLLRASSFATMTELDEFLEHHALKRIPEHLRDPDNLNEKRTLREESRLVFGLDTGILTVLLSVEAAVDRAERRVCGRAQHWAALTSRLVKHIEALAARPDLISMLRKARQHIDPSAVQKLVYG